MHPIAWLSWVSLVMVLALVTTNPYYLAILLLCVLLVAALAPWSSTALGTFRLMLLAGIGIGVFSIGVAAINGASGAHVLFDVPGPQFPEWFGGLRLGGPVTAEALAGASLRALAILCVFLGFAVFNGAVSPVRLLRLAPASLFHASLAVTVGLTLLPSIVSDTRRIREMQMVRGSRGRSAGRARAGGSGRAWRAGAIASTGGGDGSARVRGGGTTRPVGATGGDGFVAGDAGGRLALAVRERLAMARSGAGTHRSGSACGLGRERPDEASDDPPGG